MSTFQRASFEYINKNGERIEIDYVERKPIDAIILKGEAGHYGPLNTCQMTGAIIIDRPTIYITIVWMVNTRFMIVATVDGKRIDYEEFMKHIAILGPDLVTKSSN